MAIDAMPAHYAILEPSADLRERQRERLQRKLTPLVFECVEWLDGPLSDPWNGALFANEVIEALPTPRFSLRDGLVFEEHVALTGDRAFIHHDRPPDQLLSAAVRDDARETGAPLPDGYITYLLSQQPYWMQA